MMKLLLAIILVVSSFQPGRAAEMQKIRLNPMLDLNFKSKKEIYDMRGIFVDQHKNLIGDRDYKPSDEIFGQIQDGKPWWGIVGRSYYGPGEKSIEGRAKESRFLANPYLLVGLDTGFAEVIKNPKIPPAPLDFEPSNLYWSNDGKLAGVTYDVTSLLKQLVRINDTGFRKEGLEMIAYNAHDLGYSYISVDPTGSRNVKATNAIIKLGQYIHTGGSCGYNGGCNNMSPHEPAMNFFPVSLPARLHIKLWKQEPANNTAEPDMVFVIDMI